MELDLLKFVPRILSNIDTNSFSPTYGCADKPYWWYKTKDFPNARMQEYILTFALLYTKKSPKNPYFGNEQLKILAKAGLNYLVKIQNKDGSFNEWYPYENSYVATAFTMAKAADAFLFLKLDVSQEKEIINMFLSAAKWLNKSEEQVSNQVAGSAYALLVISQLTKDQLLQSYATEKIQYLSKIQLDEGWFPEYNGADIGYLQLLLDFFARYHQKSNDINCLKMADKAFKFLQYFIHPDGTSGGIYGSRGTNFTFPFGIIYFSKFLIEASYVESKIKYYPPEFMDDNYALQYHDSVLLAISFNENSINSKKHKLEKIKYFEKAGLFVINDNYYFVCNMKKGGVFLFYSKKNRYLDSGLWSKINNKIITTQWMDSNNYLINKNIITINGDFNEFPKQTLSVKKNILFRGGISLIPNQLLMSVKKLTRDMLILRTKKINMHYRRIITFNKDHIVVEDILQSDPSKIKSLVNAKAQYVPTSQFYIDFYLEKQENKLDWQKVGNDFVAKRIIGL